MDEMRVFDGVQTVNYSVNNPVFNVVISTSRPENPRENTIWINGTGNNWVYSVVKPDDENTQGWIWIQSGLECPEDIQILPSNKKNNKIYAYPIKAYTNISGGSWTRCDIEFFINGKWINPESGTIISNGQTVVKFNSDNWIYGSQNGHGKGIPSLDDNGFFKAGDTFVNANNSIYGQASWAVCKKINLNTLQPTKLLITWGKFTEIENPNVLVNNPMPGVSIKLFNTSANPYSNSLLDLAQNGGTAPIDITEYQSTFSTYPYIGIYVSRGLTTSGVEFNIVDFELS